jgi:hypothetical protein
MQSVATQGPRPAPAIFAAPVARLQAWLQRAWQQLTMDDDELYIRAASDLADLEYRLQRVARGRLQRFGPLDAGA